MLINKLKHINIRYTSNLRFFSTNLRLLNTNNNVFNHDGFTKQNYINLIQSTNHYHLPNHTYSTSNNINNSVTGNEPEYAFEMAASSIRYGPGVTKEIGMDVKNLGGKRVVLFTDKNLVKLLPVKVALESLKKEGIHVDLYENCRCEPTDSSWFDAINYTRNKNPDVIIAVGGGSVMDTAKAANLMVCHPENDLFDFVNVPIGKGLPPTKKLLPLICVPTTSGTGSETTGTAIFDVTSKGFKTGIAHRSLKPTLGIVDPHNTRTMPREVHVSSGLDILCHALESYTAIPYYLRSNAPTNPLLRPAYQGSNPISDIWSLKALEMCIKYLPRVYNNPNDFEASDNLILAATYAGIGFGNAGVHLCHAMSYPISGNNKTYRHPGYDQDKKLVPHGISVAITAPAVFKKTAITNYDKHFNALKCFDGNLNHSITKHESGDILYDKLLDLWYKLDIPNGISAFGYKKSDISDLIVGTLPQKRVTQISPIQPINNELINDLINDSYTLY